MCRNINISAQFHFQAIAVQIGTSHLVGNEMFNLEEHDFENEMFNLEEHDFENYMFNLEEHDF